MKHMKHRPCLGFHVFTNAQHPRHSFFIAAGSCIVQPCNNDRQSKGVQKHPENETRINKAHQGTLADLIVICVLIFQGFFGPSSKNDSSALECFQKSIAQGTESNPCRSRTICGWPYMPGSLSCLSAWRASLVAESQVERCLARSRQICLRIYLSVSTVSISCRSCASLCLVGALQSGLDSNHLFAVSARPCTCQQVSKCRRMSMHRQHI